jgi:hypothetical protein
MQHVRVTLKRNPRIRCKELEWDVLVDGHDVLAFWVNLAKALVLTHNLNNLPDIGTGLL